MLIMTNVRKTFNKGTINEKKALNGIDLTLERRGFCDGHRGKRSGQVHHAQHDSRRVPH